MTAREMLDRITEQLRDVVADADADAGRIEKEYGDQETAESCAPCDAAVAGIDALGRATEGIEDVIADVERWCLLDADATRAA